MTSELVEEEVPVEVVVTKAKKGFTLLEVVIALTVFAFLIGGLLGFLPWGVEGVGQVKDQSLPMAWSMAPKSNWKEWVFLWSKREPIDFRKPIIQPLIRGEPLRFIRFFWWPLPKVI